MNSFTPPPAPQWKTSDLGTFQMTNFLQHSTQIEKLQIWEQHKILDDQHCGVVFTFSLKFFPINHDEVTTTVVIYALPASKRMKPRKEVSHPVAASWSHISSRYTTDCLLADYSLIPRPLRRCPRQLRAASAPSLLSTPHVTKHPHYRPSLLCDPKSAGVQSLRGHQSVTSRDKYLHYSIIVPFFTSSCAPVE